MGSKRGVTLFSSKRALSPLIATVMLIAFAVALGAVVMNWGKGYIEESGVLPEGEIELASSGDESPVAPCERPIQLQVLMVSGRPAICFDRATNALNYRFENNGQVAIESSRMQLIGATNVLETDIDAIDVAGIKQGSVSYDPAVYGQIQKAKIVPKVGGQLCPQRALNVEEIGVCV